MTKIEITDTNEIERYKRFVQYEQTLLKEEQAWKDLRVFVKQLQYGSFSLIVKDGLPHRVDNPMQTIVLGIRL